MYSVDLNCDLGESFGAYSIGADEDVIPYITSANIACGFHAGDPSVMRNTVRLCKKHNVAVGAHPGFPDLVGFGRRKMSISPRQAENDLIYQIGALKAFCNAEGVELVHVKPHGALYNQAAADAELANAICRAILAVDPALKLLAQDGTEMERAAASFGLSFISEVFADRAYLPNGLLVPRSAEGALITDEASAVRRVLKMIKDQSVTAIDGTEAKIKADSVCVHGDSEKALLFVKKIRASLEEAGIAVRCK